MSRIYLNQIKYLGGSVRKNFELCNLREPALTLHFSDQVDVSKFHPMQNVTT